MTALLGFLLFMLALLDPLGSRVVTPYAGIIREETPLVWGGVSYDGYASWYPYLVRARARGMAYQDTLRG